MNVQVNEVTLRFNGTVQHRHQTLFQILKGLLRKKTQETEV